MHCGHRDVRGDDHLRVKAYTIRRASRDFL
jgi:hypothetical protein